MFSALRVYALTRQNIYLAGLTLTLGLVPLFVNVVRAVPGHGTGLINLTSRRNTEHRLSKPPSQLRAALQLLPRLNYWSYTCARVRVHLAYVMLSTVSHISQM